MVGIKRFFPENLGEFVVEAIADPGTNADIVWTPPANYICLPMTWSYLITTVAAGVPRVAINTVFIGASNVWETQYPQAVPIGTVQRNSGHMRCDQANLALSSILMPSPEVYLTNADSYAFTYNNKQAGDRITLFRITYLRWTII